MLDLHISANNYNMNRVGTEYILFQINKTLVIQYYCTTPPLIERNKEILNTCSRLLVIDQNKT